MLLSKPILHCNGRPLTRTTRSVKLLGARSGFGVFINRGRAPGSPPERWACKTPRDRRGGGLGREREGKTLHGHTLPKFANLRVENGAMVVTADDLGLS